MEKFSIKEAFEAEGLNMNEIKIDGVPERHKEALVTIAQLWVGADHADGDGELDYTDYSQRKYNAIAEMGSPSGRGFSLDGVGRWTSYSNVGARLSFKNRDTAETFFNENVELFKKMMVYSRKLKNLKTKKNDKV